MSTPSLAIPNTSALDPQTQAFPKLTAEQIDRIRPYGKVRAVSAGEILFEVGNEHMPMFVLLSGKLEVVQPTWSGERALVTHEPCGYSGEISFHATGIRTRMSIWTPTATRKRSSTGSTSGSRRFPC